MSETDAPPPDRIGEGSCFVSREPEPQLLPSHYVFAAEPNVESKEAATFSLTALPSEEEVEEVLRQVKERGDEGALAADILEDLNTDSIRSLRRSFDVIGGDDGVQEGEFVKMMMAYLDPDDGSTRLTGEVRSSLSS